jgi:hypothetical protein
MSWTKEERAEYNKRYREENREKINANMRYWRKHNPEKVKEYAKKNNKSQYEKHKDNPKYKAMIRENYNRWRNNHRAEYNAYQREYRRKLAERGAV